MVWAETKKRQFVKEILRRSGIAAGVWPRFATANQAIIVPVWLVRSKFLNFHIRMMQPFQIGHAHHLRRLFPILEFVLLRRRLGAKEALFLLLVARSISVQEMVVFRVFSTMTVTSKHGCHVSRIIPTFDVVGLEDRSLMTTKVNSASRYIMALSS
jgi:hypothetical protein